MIITCASILQKMLKGLRGNTLNDESKNVVYIGASESRKPRRAGEGDDCMMVRCNEMRFCRIRFIALELRAGTCGEVGY